MLSLRQADTLRRKAPKDLTWCLICGEGFGGTTFSTAVLQIRGFCDKCWIDEIDHSTAYRPPSKDEKKPRAKPVDWEALFAEAEESRHFEIDWLGVDVGFVYPAADSDGRIYHWESNARKRHNPKDFTPAGPVTVKRKGKVVAEYDPYSADQFGDLMARANEEDFRRIVHRIASQVVATARHSGRGIVLEDWANFNRRRAKWVPIYSTIIKLAKDRGVPVKVVNPAYTSQTCPQCGHVDRSNRPSRNRFECVKCKFSDQADKVAAINLRDRAHQAQHLRREHDSQCANCKRREPWRSGFCVSCYFYYRRLGHLPSEETVQKLDKARKYADFKSILEANKSG